MEEKILEIIDKTSCFAQSSLSRSRLAKEITAHVMGFIEWLAFDGLEIFIMTGRSFDKEIKTTWFDAQGGEHTLEEVYQYWFDNVYKK